MRPSNALGSDGYLNLLNSVMLARSEKSHGLGVLVCMNSQIFSSRDVTKTHTLSVDTFASYDFGALGYIVGDTIRIIHSPVCDHTVRTEFSYADIENLDALPRVELLLLHADCDSRVLDLIAETKPSAIVIEAFGHGSVQPVEAHARTLVENGILVIRSTRVSRGPVLESHARWHTMGIIPAGDLPGHKVRLLAQLVILKHGRSVDAMRKALERY